MCCSKLNFVSLTGIRKIFGNDYLFSTPSWSVGGRRNAKVTGNGGAQNESWDDGAYVSQWRSCLAQKPWISMVTSWTSIWLSSDLEFPEEWMWCTLSSWTSHGLWLDGCRPRFGNMSDTTRGSSIMDSNCSILTSALSWEHMEGVEA